MDDTWDEIWKKPAFNFLSYHPDELLRVPGKISVNEEWLKEVKAAGDELKRKADILDENLDVIKDLGALMEDAENWKKFCSWTLGECIEARNAVDKLEAMQGFKNDAEAMCKKLKVIEAWYESEKGYNFPGFEGLRKILGRPKSTSRLIE